ncbi:MAG: penicillin-binding protein 2 [Candidatus Aminicenantes bacterium]|nr:penicillin-binding protein 2 [Candidatus Aminicenantes bacterium]
MKTNKDERNRVFFLFIVIVIWALLIGSALVKVQVVDYNKNMAHVRKQRTRTFSLHPKRGAIYDSKGEVLAISVKAKSAFLSNKNKQESLQLFKRIRRKLRFHRDSNKNWSAVKDITRRINAGKSFIWIKRKLSDDEYEKLSKIEIAPESKSQLNFLEEYKRIYPQGAMAAHVLGGVGIDEQGLAGIEFELDSLIKGKGSTVEVLLDARKKRFSQEFLTRPVPGKDIYLTIDSAVQFFVERELKKTVLKYKAKSGAVIVMRSADGAILAMAGYPVYKPGAICDTSSWKQKNRPVSFLYHPGSTFKIVLAATALEKNVCYPQQVFNCYNGVFPVKNQTIYDDHPAQKLTFEEIIIHSSNIGAANIGLKLGKKRYYEGIKGFGFGAETGIRLPGEESGILRHVKNWSGVSVAFLAYGYELLVTPMQMVCAFNVPASGGYLVQPYVLARIAGEGPIKRKSARILSPSTSSRLTSIMSRVVKLGTGKKAQIEGIEIAGKTGTTKKMKGKGTQRKYYVSSFGGFFPARNPRVTIFVVIDEPSSAYYGGEVAAPLFRVIAQKLMVYLNIFPELYRENEVRI